MLNLLSLVQYLDINDSRWAPVFIALCLRIYIDYTLKNIHTVMWAKETEAYRDSVSCPWFCDK